MWPAAYRDECKGSNGGRGEAYGAGRAGGEEEVRKMGEWREEEGRSCAWGRRVQRRLRITLVCSKANLCSAGKERRDGPTQGGRGKQDRMRAEMRRKRGGDGAKGEEGWKAQRHVLVNALQAECVIEPRNERRARAVARWRLNRAARHVGVEGGCNVHGSLQIAKGAGCVKQWHHVLRLGWWRRCRVGVQAAANGEGTEKSAKRRSSGERRPSGSANQTVLEGNEARDLLRLGHACVLENNERRGSRRMGQHAAKMASSHTLCSGRHGL
ncbi:hypothetical protein B0H14DRAFT_2573533 [Mycena olivaceomarginata]|nr:hypothetical protein B0H14DRAFT_2573533 [Mycena olivaceomarginata]